MLISRDYAIENARLHATDASYGAEGHLWAYLVTGIAHLENCISVLDYGCGKGSLKRALFVTGFAVSEYDPGVPGKEAPPVPAELVVCLDVLEHIEPDCLDAVLSNLARLAEKMLFVVVSTKASKRAMIDGRDTHLSLHDDVWWARAFLDRGFTIKRVWSTGLRLWVALLEPPARAC